MERMVTHVLRDADGDITHLCQPGAPWTPRSRADAIDDIRSGVHRPGSGASTALPAGTDG